MEIDYAGLRNQDNCGTFRRGKCPIKKALRELSAKPPTSLEEASVVLFERGLAPRNAMYGEALSPKQVEEATKEVVAADCPTNSRCSVLARNGGRNFGSDVIGTTWKIGHLLKGQPQTIQI